MFSYNIGVALKDHTLIYSARCCVQSICWNHEALHLRRRMKSHLSLVTWSLC